MPIKNYLIATSIGSLPSMFVTVAIGSGIEKVIDENTKISVITVASFTRYLYSSNWVFNHFVILAYVLKKFFFKKKT